MLDRPPNALFFLAVLQEKPKAAQRPLFFVCSKENPNGTSLGAVKNTAEFLRSGLHEGGQLEHAPQPLRKAWDGAGPNSLRWSKTAGFFVQSMYQGKPVWGYF